MIARIVVEPGYGFVYAPYELRELVKTFPKRRWLPERKAWRIGSTHVDDCADALRAAGCEVFVTRPDGSAYAGRPGAGRRSTPGDDWAGRLLDAVGADRSEAVFKALTRVLHPDTGNGDTALMQQLNTARDARRVGAR